MKFNLKTCVTINKYLTNECYLTDVNKNIIKNNEGITLSLIVKLINVYCEKGLIIKHYDKKDKRKKMLKLTESFYNFKKNCENINVLNLIK